MIQRKSHLSNEILECIIHNANQNMDLYEDGSCKYESQRKCLLHNVKNGLFLYTRGYPKSDATDPYMRLLEENLETARLRYIGIVMDSSNNIEAEAKQEYIELLETFG